MQFPVPQFTDVEDKIIGALTFKQFGILFGAGIIIFLAYSSTKDVLVLIFFCVLIGLPALGLAFVPFNGRPIYKMTGVLLKYLLAPKQLIFHKDAGRLLDGATVSVKTQVAVTKVGVPVEDTQSRLRKVKKVLEKGAAEERELVRQIK